MQCGLRALALRASCTASAQEGDIPSWEQELQARLYQSLHFQYDTVGKKGVAEGNLQIRNSSSRRVKKVKMNPRKPMKTAGRQHALGECVFQVLALS